MTVPYITTWSTERPLPARLVERQGLGIGYADETLGDRDRHGVLWPRIASRPGFGRPEFGKVHPLRQRRAMRNLRCQVCAGPADRNADGFRWLLRDHRDDWQGWPDGMAVSEPPVCRPCAALAARTCPALRNGHVAVRVRRCEVSGVYGARCRPGLTRSEDALLGFGDPAIRWTKATQLLRELRGCTIVPLSA